MASSCRLPRSPRSNQLFQSSRTSSWSQRANAAAAPRLRTSSQRRDAKKPESPRRMSSSRPHACPPSSRAAPCSCWRYAAADKG
eukprot:3544132-Prymnesium_polylepis.1